MPSALLSVGRLFFFSFECFSHPVHPQKAHLAGASDLIGRLVRIPLAARVVTVQNGRAWRRLTRHATPLERAENGRLNSVLGDYPLLIRFPPLRPDWERPSK